MKTDKEEDQLADNPFLALFANANQAKQYVEVTKSALEKSNCTSQVSNESTGSNTYITSSKSDKKSKFLEKISIKSNQFKKTVAKRKEIIINDYLQRVFLFTVNPDEDNMGEVQFGGLPQRCIMLPELIEEIIAYDQPPLLSLDNLNQALFERMQMQDTVSNLCIQSGHRLKAVNAVMDAREELLVKYLGDCFLRLDREKDSMMRKCAKEKSFLLEIEEMYTKCFSLIVSFTGSILLQPDVFPTNNPHIQLFNLLTASYGDQRLDVFIHKLAQEKDEQGDVDKMFANVLHCIWDKAQNLEPLNPHTLPLLKALLFFSQTLPLSKVLTNSNYWLPPNLSSARSFETHTILGRFLTISSIPKDPLAVPKLFPEPSMQSDAEMRATTQMVQDEMTKICLTLFELMSSILRRPETQHDMLYWLGLCMYINRDRGKMFVANPMDYCSCGFFLNLSFVLLKFCEPLNPDSKSKAILKVDCRYCSVKTSVNSISKPDALLHAIGFDVEDKLATKPDNIPPVTGNQVKFKFVSEIFFLAHQCYRLGYRKTFLNYQELMRELQKLSNVYEDARAQGMENMVGNLKDDFENSMRRQIAVKAALLPTQLSELALNFCAASSFWLNQLTLAGADYMNILRPREMKAKNLPDDEEVSPPLTVIPEYMLENIGDTIRLMGLFNEESLDRCNQLRYLMEFFAIFLGESTRVRNPHLRAKLAECFTAFVPRVKQHQNMFSYSYRKNAFEASSFVPKVLPKSLLKLFVDIEFTGHAMEFEQKFTYRHYMYEILEYIWKLPGYHESFRKLYEEGKMMYKKNMVFSCFPRFINLLVNDSTFLLDEALQNLAMIKTHEQEKDRGDWDNLEVEEKKKKEENLTQFGHLARAYNTMASETVHVLYYITKDITRPFASPCMADSMAAFLNYFLVHLVGPKRKDLKVKNFEKYNFNPSNLVKNIALIYISLTKEDSFCKAVVSDERCYSDDLFISAYEILQKMEGGIEHCGEMYRVVERLKKIHAKHIDRDVPEPPDEFTDPISCMLMYEPVKLPSSGKIVCKSTIAKHLLSDEKDPFNRSPLKLDQVIPCGELQERIEEWMVENGIEKPDLNSEDCGG